MPPPDPLPRSRSWVLWDGECGLCRRFADWVRRQDRAGRLRLLAFQEAPSPPMTPELRRACRRAVHVLTPSGKTLRAGRACLFVLGELGWNTVARVGRRAPIVWGVEGGYRLVARHRPFWCRWLDRLSSCAFRLRQFLPSRPDPLPIHHPPENEMSPDNDRFRVQLNSPFHLSGEAEHSVVGTFTDCRAALEACEHLVDRFLDARRPEATDPEALYRTWRDAGPEPWIEAIAPSPKACRFSADTFARRRCRELFET